MKPLVAIGIALAAITVALRHIVRDDPEEQSPGELDEIQKSVRDARRALRQAESKKREWLRRNDTQELPEESQ